MHPAEAPAGRSWLTTAAKVSGHHVAKHMGIGMICAVAYFDPGNWGVDLQGGSQFGYKLLFTVLLAGLIAVFWQVQANKLGCVTGLDLASHCRLLFHDRPRHPRLYRWMILYPLYLVSEAAIISTDLAELLGSAIAIVLIFPDIPLWAAVMITGTDVLVLLILSNPLGGKPVKSFEILIVLMVFAILICMAIVIGKTNVDWPQAFDGYLPSKTIFKPDALYTSVGILGATVMPHSLFLGSALATQDRVSLSPSEDTESSEKPRPRTLKQISATFVAAFRVAPVDHEAFPKSHADHTNNSLVFVRAHLYHGIVNVVTSLVGMAVTINSLILILSAAVFFYGGLGESSDAASLFDAYTAIQDFVGKPAAILFALALLFAGQSASIVATLGGQVVSEGFLHWKVSPVVRRLITRLLGLVPSMVVAVAVGRPGLNTLLVISQVILSMILPCVTLPLIWLTSSTLVMRVREEIPTETARALGDLEGGEKWVDFSNGKFVMGIGYATWLVTVAANVYVLVVLGLGEED